MGPVYATFGEKAVRGVIHGQPGYAGRDLFDDGALDARPVAPDGVHGRWRVAFRVKGILETEDGLVVVQSAQRAVSPPRSLSRGSADWTGSRLVVVSRGLGAAALEALAATAVSAAEGRRRAPAGSRGS